MSNCCGPSLADILELIRQTVETLRGEDHENISFYIDNGMINVDQTNGATISLSICELFQDSVQSIDNGDGTFTLNDKCDRHVITFREGIVDTVVDNGDGTYSYKTDVDGDGVPEVVVETWDGATYTTVHDGNGSYTFRRNGVDVETWDGAAYTVTDNGDGSYTFKRNGVDVTTWNIDISQLCMSEPIDIDGCRDGQQLMVYEDSPGCWKIAVLAAVAKATTTISTGVPEIQQPYAGPEVSYVWPDDFGAKYDSVAALQLDDDAGNGTVNEALIANNIISSGDFVLGCNTSFDVLSRLSIKQEATVDEAYATSTSVFYRYSVNGGSWVYIRQAGSNLISSSGFSFNGLSKLYENSGRMSIPAGNIKFQVFAVKTSDSATVPVTKLSVTNNNGAGGNSLSTRLTPDLG